MKDLFVFMIIIAAGYLITSCQDITVGYLLTEGASYNPDSLVIKGENSLDVEGEDYIRVKWGQPWVSTSIEGVEGTAQVIVSIKSVSSTNGNPDKLRDVLSVRGDGTLEIPLHHDIPAGSYVISLNFSNEGYSKDVNDCFTVIVK